MLEEEIKSILAQPFISRADAEYLGYIAIEILDANEHQADMIKSLIDEVEFARDKLKKRLEFYHKVSNIRPMA